MKRNLFILLLLIPLTLSADLLTDIVSGTYKPKTLPELTFLNDGEHYASLTDGKVCTYDCRTGNLQSTLFDPADTKLLKIDTIEGFLLSPDERFLLVYKDRQQIYRRSFKAHYYLYNIERHELFTLASDSLIASPLFSPDSKYIAYSFNNNLYIYKIAFGTEVAVTTDGQVGSIINGTTDWLYEEEFSTTSLFTFSPDSKQLAFVRFDESLVPQFTWQEMLTPQYPLSYSLKYPRAGETNAAVSVVVYDTYYKSLKTMQLSTDDAYIPRLRWIDNTNLAIFRINRNQNKLEMYYANPKSTVTKRYYIEEYKQGYINYELIDYWQFLSDGSFIVLNETDNWQHAWLYSPTGQRQRLLTDTEADVMQIYGYNETTQTLYYQLAVTPMQRKLYAYNLKKNKCQCLTSTDGTHTAQFSSNYHYFIDAFSSIEQPNTYTLRDNQGKAVRVLLDNQDLLNRFQALNLPQKQFFSFTTERGDVLNGWMLLPAAFDQQKQYPVLQVQYSGPASQMVYDRWKIDWEYFLAQQGIIVVCVDGRGTDARGRLWRQQYYKHVGTMEPQDQVSVAHYMQSLPYVRKDKIGIWGWSFGGYMTLLSMSQPNSPFCCGIAVAPVTDFRFYDSAYTERFMQRPQSNEKAYDDCSLLNKADQLQGRLLLVHGLADDNVHCQQTWQYINALVKANKQFDLQIYPDDNHFLRKRNNYQHLYQRKWEFLQHYLLEE